MKELEGAWIKEAANPRLCHSIALTVTWASLPVEREERWGQGRRHLCHLKYRIGSSPAPRESSSAVNFSHHFPVKVSRMTPMAWSLAVACCCPCGWTEGFRPERTWAAQAEENPHSGLPDLTNTNTGHPVKYEFLKNIIFQCASVLLCGGAKQWPRETIPSFVGFSLRGRAGPREARGLMVCAAP